MWWYFITHFSWNTNYYIPTYACEKVLSTSAVYLIPQSLENPVMDLLLEITGHNASWLHPQTHVLSPPMTFEINCGSFWNFPSRSWYFHSSLSRWHMNLAAILSFSGNVSKCYGTLHMSFPNPSQSTMKYLFSWTSSLISVCSAGRWMTWMVQHPWQTSVHPYTSKTTQHFISAVSSPMARFNISRFL